MPVLRQRPDGGYYTKANFGAIATIQIGPEAVKCLADRGYGLGDEFSRSLLKYCWQQGWAYTLGKGKITFDQVSFDEHERGQPDQYVSIAFPSLRIQEHDNGTLGFALVLPQVSPEWLVGASREEIARLEAPSCCLVLGSERRAADRLRSDFLEMPVTPECGQDITVCLEGEWPHTLDICPYQLPVAGLSAVEIFALPHDGGKRLRTPQLAPGDELLVVLQRGHSGAERVREELSQALGSTLEFARIADWDMVKITIPATERALETVIGTLNARRAHGRWSVDLLSPPPQRLLTGGIAVFRTETSVLACIRYRSARGTAAQSGQGTLYLRRERRLEQHQTIRLTNDHAAIVDLGELGPGRWLLAIRDHLDGYGSAPFVVIGALRGDAISRSGPEPLLVDATILGNGCVFNGCGQPPSPIEIQWPPTDDVISVHAMHCAIPCQVSVQAEDRVLHQFDYDATLTDGLGYAVVDALKVFREAAVVFDARAFGRVRIEFQRQPSASEASGGHPRSNMGGGVTWVHPLAVALARRDPRRMISRGSRGTHGGPVSVAALHYSPRQGTMRTKRNESDGSAFGKR